MRKLIEKLVREAICEGYDHMDPSNYGSLPKYNSDINFPSKDMGEYILICKLYNEKEYFGILGEIFAYSKIDNTEIGNVSFGYDETDGNKLKGAIDVRPDMRRKGIGSEMYKFIEEILKEKITPDLPHSELASKMWGQPNRNFGE